MGKPKTEQKLIVLPQVCILRHICFEGKFVLSLTRPNFLTGAKTRGEGAITRGDHVNSVPDLAASPPVLDQSGKRARNMTMTQLICSVVFNRHFECYVSYILLWNLLNTAYIQETGKRRFIILVCTHEIFSANGWQKTTTNNLIPIKPRCLPLHIFWVAQKYTRIK